MRPFGNSTIILAMFFCLFISNIVSAGILWEKDLIYDTNSNSAPLTSCLNKDGNGIVVMTIECPKGSYPIKGDTILWEIGADGNATRISPKNSNGSKVWTNADSVGYGCAMASDNLDNLLTIGVLNKQEDEKGQKIAIISKHEKSEKTMSPLDPIEHHSIKKMIPLRDNTFMVVGDINGNGLLLQIDNKGKTLKKNIVDLERTDILSDIDRIKPDNSYIAVAGISANISVKDPNEELAEYFILIYDSNLNKIGEDYFMGGLPRLLFPKVCCLDNGNIVFLYKIKSDYPKTLLWARCYTKELKLLWEKEIFTADKMPFFFDIISRSGGGFIAWIGEVENLNFCYFDDEGAKINNLQYKGSVTHGGGFGVAGFNLFRVNEKTIAVFKEGTAGNIKEVSVKGKVIALD